MLSKRMAMEMARINLQAGNEVIIPQILQTTELADSFKQLAQDCAADYYEVLLDVSKNESIKRFIERSKSQGYPTGFREGAIIATSGREAKLVEMHDSMTVVTNNRPHIIRIQPILGDVDSTYSMLLQELV